MIWMTRILGILFIFGFRCSDRRLLIRLNQVSSIFMDFQDWRKSYCSTYFGFYFMTGS